MISIYIKSVNGFKIRKSVYLLNDKIIEEFDVCVPLEITPNSNRTFTSIKKAVKYAREN